MYILRMTLCTCDKYQNFTRSGLSRSLCGLKCFAIILKRKKKLVALLLLSYGCIFTINVLWFFLTVPWVCLQYVTVVFPIVIILTYFFIIRPYCSLWLQCSFGEPTFCWTLLDNVASDNPSVSVALWSIRPSFRIYSIWRKVVFVMLWLKRVTKKNCYN